MGTGNQRPPDVQYYIHLSLSCQLIMMKVPIRKGEIKSGISVYLQIQNDKDGTNIQQCTAHMHIVAYTVAGDVKTLMTNRKKQMLF